MSTYARARQRTENRLLDATLTCLLRDGYQRLTVTAIAEAADVGRGTFYQYFHNADDALLTVAGRYFTHMQAEAHAMMAQYESPEKEIRAWQMAYEHAHALKPLFVMLADPDASGLARRFQQVMIAGFEQSLSMDAFQYPTWMALPLDVMATFSAGAVFALMQRWLAGELDYSASEMAAMTYKLLYHQPPG